MFNNRSFAVLAPLAALAVVTLIFGTAVGTPPAVPRAIGATDWFERHPVTAPIPARSMGYAELKDAQLEQKDAEQFGSARIIVAGGEDSYHAMQKEQRAMQQELRAATNSAPSVVSAPAISVRSERYAALKEAQLEQKDAEQFGSASIRVAGGEDSYHAMQKEQRAMQKELRAAISPALTQPNAPIEGWIYLHDSVTNKWYAYPATTPPGTIIDIGNVYELRNGPGNSASGCGLSTEPDC